MYECHHEQARNHDGPVYIWNTFAYLLLFEVHLQVWVSLPSERHKKHTPTRETIWYGLTDPLKSKLPQTSITGTLPLT